MTTSKIIESFLTALEPILKTLGVKKYLIRVDWKNIDNNTIFSTENLVGAKKPPNAFRTLMLLLLAENIDGKHGVAAIKQHPYSRKQTLSGKLLADNLPGWRVRVVSTSDIQTSELIAHVVFLFLKQLSLHMAKDI